MSEIVKYWLDIADYDIETAKVMLRGGRYLYVGLIKELNPLNIEARYPEYKDQVAAGLTNDICVEILAGTEEMLCWIKEQ